MGWKYIKQNECTGAKKTENSSELKKKNTLLK